MTEPPELSRGELYDSGYERRAAAGENVHGEADFVAGFSPSAVLDAGCGTGRVGRELVRRGVTVVGVDLDAEMLATARSKCPQASWIHADLSLVQLEGRFDVVLMAGNVINFVSAPRRRAAILNMAGHLAANGLLICGHSIRPDGCDPDDFDRWAAEAGLELSERWSTWQREPFAPRSDYSLTVHRRQPS